MPILDLAYNLIGDRGAGRIADLCKLNPFISTINLEHNLVSDLGAKALASIVSVESKAQVTIINLANNQLSSQGLIALSEALKRTYYALTIDVSYNRLIGRSGILSITNSDLSLDWILLRVRSQVSTEEASNPPPPSSPTKGGPSLAPTTPGGGRTSASPSPGGGGGRTSASPTPTREQKSSVGKK